MQIVEKHEAHASLLFLFNSLSSFSSTSRVASWSKVLITDLSCEFKMPEMQLVSQILKVGARKLWFSLSAQDFAYVMLVAMK